MNDPDVKLYCVVLRDEPFVGRADRVLRVSAYTAHDAGVQASLQLRKTENAHDVKERVFAIEPWTEKHNERFGDGHSYEALSGFGQSFAFTGLAYMQDSKK